MSRDLHRQLREAWIIEAVRTPVGRYGGALASVRPDDLAAAVIRAVVDRSGIDPALIEDVILGCANQAGEDNRNVARMALLLAGLPVEVGGLTVNRLCGSGLQAINSAAHAIAVDDGDVFIGGGVESMTRAPYVMAKAEAAWDRGPRELQDTTLGWRFLNPKLAERYYPYSMGETAENVAERWEVGRDLQDAFALASQQKAIAAIEGGRFDTQIVPIPVPQRKGDPVIVSRDEHPRADTSAEALARLRPAFREGGTRDRRERVRDQRRRVGGAARRGRPGARARAAADGAGRLDGGRRRRPGRDGRSGRSRPPARRSIGPGSAWPTSTWSSSTKRSRRSRIVCINELGLDPDRVNVNGGAIALGHPLGMSGGRLITMLAHELRRTGGRYGLATMCIGVGQGIATVIERIDE